MLSFGTAGCNLACKFCQNWDISKSRQMDTLADAATPEKLAQAAVALGCRSVAFTYNDPVIFHEYAIDVARACHEHNIKTVAVTAGYVCAAPCQQFYHYIDAANVDLKAFTERFYRNVTGSSLKPVLEILVYLKHDTQVWLDIATLLIPGENDSDAELEEMTGWIAENHGLEVPLHFSAFHPDWKMRDIAATSPSVLIRARQIAINNGLKFVYTGNVHDPQGGTTHCPGCGMAVIVRDWYVLTDWNLDADGRCNACGTACPGIFDQSPGDWGNKRQPVRLA